MDEVKYPNITVELVGQNGNAFNLMGLVNQALRKGKVSQEERNLFMKEAMSSGSYDNLLVTLMKWVNVE